MEVWWLVPEELKYRFALQFQIAHMFTWARFQAAVGINDLALSGAFFSGVSIDKMVRKSPYESTLSPSNPVEDEFGEELTMKQLLDKISKTTKHTNHKFLK